MAYARNMHPLDDPVRSALAGPHAQFAERVGDVLRYPVDVAPFAVVPTPFERTFAAVQMTADRRLGAPDPAIVELGPDDVGEMLALAKRTNPGPFLPRTIELGRYIGVRDRGELVAMAGERLRVPGWTEVSAVCTAPTHRGQGLASRLVRAVAAGIEARGERAFLHAAATNTGAIRVYEALGFAVRREVVVGVGDGGEVTFTVVPAPARTAA